ncbi:MAG TPA: thymidine phosphorylase [Candidatus Saccharimonadales bacterium]|nr:thymidine phosphorylase [Candidatus Saccharimonadales bacterium]
MNARDLIVKKRDAGTLSDAEIRWLVLEFAAGRVPEYQMSAFLMAVFFRGMDGAETVSLTRAMLESGRRLEWPEFPEPKADKHSTGGVGDKVSLALAPLAAACGLRVPMLSGRGLGHTGGTLDKLEAMRGYRTRLSPEEFRRVLAETGCVIAAQTEVLAPADKVIYALRDVTGTVECIPLIVASILSKKAAAGVESLVFDIKCGDGAFMKTEARAVELARALVDVSAGLGMRALALVTNMDEPLGLAVGNALETAEAVQCLRGAGPPDLRELTLRLAGAMVYLSGLEPRVEAAYQRARGRLDDGSAARRFGQWVSAQGAELGADGGPVLDLGVPGKPLPAPRDGYIARIATTALGLATVRLGAGRLALTDVVDPGVGVVLAKKVGDPVRKGEPLAALHARRPVPALEAEIAACFEVGPGRVAPRPLVSHVVTAEGVRSWEEWAR